MIQITVVKISGYGPWTLTLGYDREYQVQMLQSSLYAKMQRLFAEKECLVFPNRYDEFVVASNGLDMAGHRVIQEDVHASFEVKLDMYAGIGDTPYQANLMAHRSRTNDTFLSKASDTDYDDNDDDITIMHMDVENLTSRTTRESPYDISVRILNLYHAMAQYFVKRQSLSFFMGGDNFMILSSESAKADAEKFVRHIQESQGIALNCGIGRSRRARRAAALATRSLDMIRDMRHAGKQKPRVYEA